MKMIKKKKKKIASMFDSSFDMHILKFSFVQLPQITIVIFKCSYNIHVLVLLFMFI